MVLSNKRSFEKALIQKAQMVKHKERGWKYFQAVHVKTYNSNNLGGGLALWHIEHNMHGATLGKSISHKGLFYMDTDILWTLFNALIASSEFFWQTAFNKLKNGKLQTCSSKSAAWDSFSCSCKVKVVCSRDCFSTSILIPAEQSISWTACTSSAADTRPYWSSLPGGSCTWRNPS